MRDLVLIWVSMLVGLMLLAFGAGKENTSAPNSHPSPTVASTAPREAPKQHDESRIENAALYPVLKVVDGDTVVINKDGKNVTLRLIGMDAPETTTLRKGVVECFGEEATRRATELLAGTPVSIETDSSQGTYDKYERTLAYVILPDGRNFAEVMIADGFAHEYTYNTPYKYQKEFRDAQTRAQAEKRGLWSDAACTKKVEKDIVSAIPRPVAGTYECSKNTYNCSSFKTQAEAQSAFNSCGGSGNDVHKLDSDGDGSVCEGLP